MEPDHATEPQPLTDDDREVLDLLRRVWPDAFSCTRLATLLGWPTYRAWPALDRLEGHGRVESEEVVWQAKRIVYKRWRAAVLPEDFAPGRDGEHVEAAS